MRPNPSPNTVLVPNTDSPCKRLIAYYSFLFFRIDRLLPVCRRWIRARLKASSISETRRSHTRFSMTSQVLEKMERETGFEPATSSLGSWHSTAELLPLSKMPP